MPTTADGIPYPDGGDPPNLPADLQALAEAVGPAATTAGSTAGSTAGAAAATGYASSLDDTKMAGIDADSGSTFRAQQDARLSATIAAAVPPATTTTPGRVELATDAEAKTGTDTTRALTPSRLVAVDADAASALRVQQDARLSATYAELGAIAAVQPIMKKLVQAVEDINILELGDSIDGSFTNWFGRLSQWLATEYPDWTVKYRDWDSTATQAWAAWSTVQAGTNGRTIWFSNGAVGGQTSDYPLGNRLRPMVGDVQADLTFVSYNANYDFNTAATAYQIRDKYAALCEQVLLYSPQTSIVVIGKPGKPLTPNAVEYRNDRLRAYVRAKGFGYIDVYQAFVDADPSWATNLIQGDQIHPTTTQNDTPPSGQDVFLAEVKRQFAYQPGVQLNSQKPSSFAEPIPASANLILNGDFSDWTDAALPAGWVGSNATMTKDTAWFETGTYGAKLTATVADTASYISKTLDPVALNLRGQWITVAARVRTDETLAHRNSNGLVKVGDSVNPTAVGETPCTAGAVTTTDGFKWNVVSFRVANTAVAVTVFLMNQLGGAADHATYDRIIVVRGQMPKDVRPVPQPISSYPPGLVRKMNSGCYYGPICSAGPSATAVGAGIATATPLWVPPGGVTVSAIACEVTTAGAGDLRLGIYASDSNDKPGALVLDAGAIAGALGSTGVKEITGLSQRLDGGLYWLVAVAQNTPSGSVRTVGVGPAQPVAATSFIGTSGSLGMNGYNMAVAGALPSPFVAAGAIAHATLVKIKAA